MKIFRGGFRINRFMQGSYPLAKLSVGDNLELKTGYIIFSKLYTFNLDEIIIKIKEGFSSNRIYIIHNNANYPQEIEFFSCNLRGLLELLEAKGVEIEGELNEKKQRISKFFNILGASVFILMLTLFVIGSIFLIVFANI